jgi:hypothetical protein
VSDTCLPAGRQQERIRINEAGNKKLKTINRIHGKNL